MRVKQVIIIRKDLKMRRGKEIAQGAHASIDFLIERIKPALRSEATSAVSFGLSENEIRWMSDGMAKVCLQIDSEAELVAIHEKARTAGLESHLICDSGRTEFGGQPTLTACAIGPAEDKAIDSITGDLRLY